jgi:outer membrane protein OmpA-like peptidoglycan-associated protein
VRVNRRQHLCVDELGRRVGGREDHRRASSASGCYDRAQMATMRAVLAASLVLLAAPGRADAEPPPAPAPAQRPALKVLIDRSKVDLVGHKLEVKLSRPAARVTLKVFGESGAILADVEKKFDGAAAGTALALEWTPSSDETVTKIEVFGYDTENYYAGVAIIPWKATVPHQEVNFPTNSDAIGATEVPKLQASLDKIREVAAKHAELGKVTLFVLGHTDTVGTDAQNLALSRRRARAIAAWFRARGLTLAIAFEGLGERSPLVKTPDETDESRNRRADYILALEPPPLPAGEFSWKGL